MGQKQVDGNVYLTHASGGIDAGSQHEADGGSVEGIRVTAAFFYQRRQTGASGALQGLQPPGDEHPVLPHQGNHVGHRTQAHHVGVFPEHFFRVAAEGTHQLEGQRHAGQILVRVGVAGLMGVNDGNGQRQLVLALVVVGNHQVNAQLVTQLRFRNGGDAAVHGDN